MEFILTQKRGVFLERENRFVGRVEVLESGKKKEVKVHIPNTGRCKELLYEGNEVVLEERLNPSRKYKYELILVMKQNKWISIDSQLPNKLAAEGILSGVIKELVGYDQIKMEHTEGNSRFDILLSRDSGEKCFVEVKGVTLEKERMAMFPDAPTERGRKHINELIRLKKEGNRAAVLFIVQMEDVDQFRPYYENDLEFARSLKEAYQVGVEIMVYKCIVSEMAVEVFLGIPCFFTGFS